MDRKSETQAYIQIILQIKTKSTILQEIVCDIEEILLLEKVFDVFLENFF